MLVAMAASDTAWGGNTCTLDGGADGGSSAAGSSAIACGLYNLANGGSSSAFGSDNQTDGTNSIAFGADNVARGYRMSSLPGDALQWNGTLDAHDASHSSGNPQKISNVAQGVSPADAANVAQVQAGDAATLQLADACTDTPTQEALQSAET
jgi:hypothetical protein